MEASGGSADAPANHDADPEPLPPGHALLRLPSVLVTPHLTGAQGGEVRRLGLYAIEGAEHRICGEPPHGAITAAELTRPARPAGFLYLNSARSIVRRIRRLYSHTVSPMN